MELRSFIYDGNNPSWTRGSNNPNTQPPPGEHPHNTWERSLLSKPHGTLPNGSAATLPQKYYILDQDYLNNMGTLQA